MYDSIEIQALRERIEKLEKAVRQLAKQLRINLAEDLEPVNLREIQQLLRNGEKNKAIKLYRRKTGCGLKEAVEFIKSIA